MKIYVHRRGEQEVDRERNKEGEERSGERRRRERDKGGRERETERKCRKGRGELGSN